eukprot:4101080-Ditylum_brightwellii.AAC.1
MLPVTEGILRIPFGEFIGKFFPSHINGPVKIEVPSLEFELLKHLHVEIESDRPNVLWSPKSNLTVEEHAYNQKCVNDYCDGARDEHFVWVKLFQNFKDKFPSSSLAIRRGTTKQLSVGDAMDGNSLEIQNEVASVKSIQKGIDLLQEVASACFLRLLHVGMLWVDAAGLSFEKMDVTVLEDHASKSEN